MKRIGITQRQDAVNGRDERRDALDARWAPLLETLGLQAVPVPNGLHDAAAWAKAMLLDGLILSGGNDLSGESCWAGERAPDRERSERALLHLAAARGWPVLGVCHGLQAMQVHLGGALQAREGHVATRHSLQAVADPCPGAVRSALQAAGRWPPGPLEVNSYHRHGIDADRLVPALRPWWVDAQGGVEAAEHVHLRWVGLLWHPERELVLPAFDRAILETLFEPR